MGDTAYEGPLTGEQAPPYLGKENMQWTGKLTAKNSKVGLTSGIKEVDPAKTYVMWLPRVAGKRSCMLHVLSSICGPGRRSNSRHLARHADDLWQTCLSVHSERMLTLTLGQKTDEAFEGASWRAARMTASSSHACSESVWEVFRT